jgi:hypothetical protein
MDDSAWWAASIAASVIRRHGYTVSHVEVEAEAKRRRKPWFVDLPEVVDSLRAQGCEVLHSTSLYFSES